MTDAAVIVVGAGPVGLVAALALARAGVAVALVEREGGPSEEFRASTFHPPTLEMLDALDLTAPLIQLGLVSPTWQIRMHETGARAVFDLGLLAADTRYPFRLQCEQRHLTRLAGAAAAKVASIAPYYGHALTWLTQDDDGVTVDLEGPTGPARLRARYLIGADGARSTVREAVSAAFEGETYPETTLLATTPFRFEERLEGLSNVNYVWSAEGTFSLLRLPQMWRCSLYAEEGEATEDALSPASIERKLQRIAPDAAPYVVTERRAYRVHRRLIDAYRYGRVLFAGDAAHLTSPSGGMGMNGGIHDAFSLADKLIAVLQRGADPALLDLYGRQRRPVAADEILAQAGANRARMQQRDPAWRAGELARLQALVADSEAHRAHLLRTSMIAGLQRAAEIQ